MADTLLAVQNVTHDFSLSKTACVRALARLSFSIRRGEIYGLVGESGSGKSPAARCVMNLVQPRAGQIFYQGIDITNPRQFAANKKLLQTSRQMIFQDSTSSLNGRMKVCDIIAEPMRIARMTPKRGTYRKEAAFQMKYVGLDEMYLDKYPAELSGGQRQRVAIARALCMEPELLVADEPVSALDVSIQAQIINLLKSLQEKRNLTYLFIAHDLSMVKHISDRVGVMYLGNMVEFAESDELYQNPLHPYTKALMAAIPIPDPDTEEQKKRIRLEGEIPSPVNPKPGCRFVTRCRYATEKCHQETPQLEELKPEHFVACHRAKELMEDHPQE